MDVYPRIGRRRPARQQDELRGAPHAHPERHRRRVAGGAVAVQEQGDGDEDAEEQAVPDRGGQAARRRRRKLDATKTDVSFGSQIRSYVFQPYTMVNDHRTELKIPDVQKVMDGGIDPFIEAYLKHAGGERGAPRERRAELRPAGAARQARRARCAAGVEPFAYSYDAHARRGRRARCGALRPTRQDEGRDGRGRRAHRRVARARQDGVRASRRRERAHPALLPEGRAGRRRFAQPRALRHRRRRRRERADASARAPARRRCA